MLYQDIGSVIFMVDEAITGLNGSDSFSRERLVLKCGDAKLGEKGMKVKSGNWSHQGKGDERFGGGSEKVANLLFEEWQDKIVCL